MSKNLNSKELFELFSKKEKGALPFSLQFSWWNEVVLNSWEVLMVSNDNQVSAIWPIHIRKRGVWSLLVQPHFTPYSGIYMVYPEGQKQSTKISFENKICTNLISQLPAFDELKQNFHLGFNNSLPMIWEGFEDIKRFTYLLDLSLKLEQIQANFRDNIKKQIKKAEKQIQVNETNSACNLKVAFESTFKAQNSDSPIDDVAIFERIATYIQKYECGKILEAKDDKGNLHASSCIVWDANQAYYLIGGAMQEFKNSGAMSLLLWQGIQLAKNKGLNHFNFEGSSISAIEKYLRGFGGELISFSCLYKSNSSSLKLAKKIIS
jgi:hypothetical protein